jgi:tRNA(Met) cytidine acetyltransferase
MVLAVAVISAEGCLPDALVQQIYQGQRRVQGHLAAQSLVYHCLTAAAGALSIWRIQRVMVQPELQQQGLGKQLLSQISALAQLQQVDLLSTSFGATVQLVQFWQRLGFVAVKLSQQAEQSSNEFSVLMCRPLQSPPIIDFAALQHWFGGNLYQLADSVWSTLDVVLLREWALPPVQQWSDFDQQNLQLFVAGQRDWQQSRVMLGRWLDLNYQHLSADEAALWLRHCWQGAAQSLPAHALNALALQLRQTRRLADKHQVFSS